MGIHLCVWLYVFLTPLLFRGPRESFEWLRYLRGCTMPLLAVGVFYMNYLLLVPRYYMSSRWARYLAHNLALVLVAIVIQEVMMNLVFPPIKPHLPIGVIAKPKAWIVMLFSVRGLLTYSFMAVTAVALRLSLSWHATEVDRQRAELLNLKSQLNPHFLLNTLNNIYALMDFDTPKARAAILQLAGMLRYMLYEDSARPVKLLREIDFLRQYIDLMKLRVADNVDVRLDVQLPPNCVHEVMPNIFVSLVENAFKHGVGCEGKSFVHVSCVHSDDGTVTFSVRNSNHPKPSTDHQPGGIGLQQVARRLELLYPGQYSWTHGPSADGLTYMAEIVLRRG